MTRELFLRLQVGLGDVMRPYSETMYSGDRDDQSDRVLM